MNTLMQYKCSFFFGLSLLAWGATNAQEVADGFNYPVGARNPGFVTSEVDPDDTSVEAGSGIGDDGWRVAQAYEEPNSELGGLHSGEDWNDECGGSTDIGAAVYAIAHGTIVGIGGHSAYGGGEAIVLRHEENDGNVVYSMYLHIDVDVDLAADFALGQRDVRRDQQIGTIAAITNPHLHFEIRDQLTIEVDEQGQLGEDLWPNDVGTSSKAYYENWPDENGEEVTAEARMLLDGLRDPSEFLGEELGVNRPAPSDLQRGRIPESFQFERELSNGTCRHEVRYLQTLLNLDPDTTVASGEAVGSLGYEISKFGPATQAAVEKFQREYLDWTATNGFWGIVETQTRDALNQALRDFRAYPNVDVAIIVDSSGSMTTNDPDDARLDAARAYLTGSFSGDYVGIIEFDSSATVPSPLLELPANRDALIEAIDTIDSSGGTNIGLGIQAGCDELLASSSVHNLTKGAIFLTDGLGGSSAQRECFSKRRWPIYAFGLGDGVDDAELGEIADETGGEYTPLPFTSLICEYQRVRAKIAGANPPPCTSFAILPFEFISFFVEVEPVQLQITFSVDWLGSDIITSLIAPSGRRIDMHTDAPDVSHDKGATFEIFTVTDPELGTWEVELYGADIPDGGEEATFGYVTVPAQQISVPDVVGQTQSDAESAILSAGFALGTISTVNSASVPLGTVISSDPTAGNLIVAGSSVSLVVSLGPQDSDDNPQQNSGGGGGSFDTILLLALLLMALLGASRRVLQAGR